mgnify:CR=1 FL=1
MDGIIYGIDVSKDELEFCSSSSQGSGSIKNSLGSIQKFIKRLQAEKVCVVVVEATGGYERLLVAELWAAGLPVAVVNPRQTWAFGKSLGCEAKTDAIDAKTLPVPTDIATVLKKLISCPDVASKRWIYEQYDHMVMADTLQRPGGDAAVVRIHGSDRALALVTDCTPRYCDADPRTGGAQAVAETCRNITAVGARPLAITDCMNFGNPERPEIMGQFAGCIEGMAEACKALDFPVVSGNVSLYNDTGTTGVQPTPSIGGVGILDNLRIMQTTALKGPGHALVQVGHTRGFLGASLYLREIAGREDGAPPPVDLAVERRNGDFVRRLIGERAVDACHDVSDGGLLVALAEMALAGRLGFEINAPSGVPLHAFLFGEDQGRYLVTCANPDSVVAAAAKAGVPTTVLGRTGPGDALTLNGRTLISLASLRSLHEGWFPAYMSAS